MNHYYFGLEFDELCYPEILNNQTLSIGPNKLLEVLESILNLSGGGRMDFLRVEQYRQVLLGYIVMVKPAKPFFMASFEADSLATAERLLQQRDELLLSGWDFELSGELPTRLKVFAELETMLKSENTDYYLANGRAERWLSAQLSLANFGEEIPIARITLNEPLELLPQTLQTLFQLLAHKGIAIDQLAAPAPNPSTDLGSFQLFLEKKIKSAPFRNDGSLKYLHCGRESYAAAWWAQTIKNNPNHNLVCLIPDKSRTLDNALVEEGLPSLGILSSSKARPVQQLLKLAPSFLWYPVDPNKVLEFVSLPLKPLDDKLGIEIAKLIASKPGTRGDEWNGATYRFFKEWEERDDLDKEDRQKLENAKTQFKFWFERKRIEVGKPVPRADAAAIFQFVASWAADTRKEEDKLNSLAMLQAQANKVAQWLAALPENHTFVTALEIERLVKSVFQASAVRFGEEEMGHLPYFHAQSGLQEPIQNLLWWNFVGGGPLVEPQRWYEAERAYLGNLGIALEDMQKKAALQQWQRRRPFMMTTHSVLLMAPDNAQGKPTEAHSFVADLEACFSGDSKWHESFWNIEEQTANLIIALPRNPQQVQLKVKPLTKAKPWIYLKNRASLVPRDKESFSSLDSLFYYPYKWVFQQKARLSMPPILSVVETHTLLGNLSHRLIELLLNENPLEWKKEQVESYLKSKIPNLLEQEGSTMLLYGRQPEVARFERILTHAAWQLIQGISQNGWSIAGTEKELSGVFCGLPLAGRADLLLSRDEELCVVDIKYSGKGKFEDRLTNQTDLQLTLYSRMACGGEGWAHTAYFVVTSGKFYARNRLAFKDCWTPNEEQSHIPVQQEIWQKMEQTYHWRMGQLAQGELEIRTEENYNAIHVDAPTDTQPNWMNLLEMQRSDAPYDDFRTLIGS